MAVREIRVQGDAVLEKVCKEVKALTPRNLVLIEDMLDTMYEAQGGRTCGASGWYFEKNCSYRCGRRSNHTD